jgi:hypothetical protein
LESKTSARLEKRLEQPTEKECLDPAEARDDLSASQWPITSAELSLCSLAFIASNVFCSRYRVAAVQTKWISGEAANRMGMEWIMKAMFKESGAGHGLPLSRARFMPFTNVRE